VERAWRWCRRNKTVAALMAVVVIALLVGTTVSTYFAIRANQEKELSEYRLYLAEMIAARQAWQEGRITLVEQYLQAHEPKRPGERDRRGFEWYYLQRLCQLNLRTIRSLAGGAFCLVVSPDGRTLATGGRDNSVKLWDVATGQEIRTLGRHTRPVQAVAFRPDGHTLASAGLD
jgi:WD domain, G-beta repeat